MKVVLTIDDDVYDCAKILADRTKRSFCHVVNEALRIGLDEMNEHVDEKHYYETTPHKMGLRQGYCLDNVQEVLAHLDGEACR